MEEKNSLIESQEVFSNLSKFKFKEVINSDVTKKAIFLHLENTDQNMPAVLICNKQAFEEDSSKIMDWCSTSKLQFITSNDVFGNYELLMPQQHNSIKSTLIYPANELLIQKYRCQEVLLLEETPKDYQELTLPYIKDSLPNLKWVYNFLEKRAESERIVFEDENPHNGFLLAPDLKWNGENIDELYLQAIVNRRGLNSVRDLTANDLPLLENIRDKVRQFCKEKYGIELPVSQLRMYFHYQPSYYHLHVHINHIKYEFPPGLSHTSILLDTAIANIKICPDFYQKATLRFARKTGDDLFKKFLDAKRVK